MGDIGGTVEQCEACGFDAARWRVADAVSLLDALGTWWRLATGREDRAALNFRPAPAVWSALEYGLHSAMVTGVIRTSLETLLLEDGLVVAGVGGPSDAAPSDPVLDLDPAEIVAAVEREGRSLAQLARDAGAEQWRNVAQVDGRPVGAEAALFHAVHDATHHQMDVGLGLARIGAGPATQRGRVEQINTSGGGVPKTAVSDAVVHYHGVVGDRQADSKHHGRPFQALCLWSAEVIVELASAGHGIGAGLAGENFTLSGLDWTRLRPGARLRIGTVLAEISFPAVPCAKQKGWFSDGDFTRIAYDRNPDLARWYAWVREPGRVRAGDEVVLQPDAD